MQRYIGARGGNSVNASDCSEGGGMKWFLATVCALGVLGRHFYAAADDDLAAAILQNASNVSLAAEGDLQRIREPLAQIFQFKIESGQLKLNRAAWEPVAAEIETKNAAAAKEAEKLPPGMDPNSPQGLRFQARLLELKARKVERQQHGGPQPPIPPLHSLFQRVVETARQGSRGFSGGSGYGGRYGYTRSGGEKEWQNVFRGEALAGKLRSNDDGDELVIEELKLPKRTLEFATDKASGFRLQISNPQGDMILLRQRGDGYFAMITMLSGKARVSEGNSFLAVAQRQRSKLGTDSLPVLAKCGICPVLSPSAPEVRKAVASLVLRTPDAEAKGKQLLDDLAAANDETRQNAERSLSNLYDRYCDFIHRRLQDPLSPAGVCQSLQRVVNENSEMQRVGETIAVLDLLNDPGYIATFLDDADPREYLKIVRRLEAITGQQLGTGAAAWKQWAEHNR
jgi:hypothetical protein